MSDKYTMFMNFMHNELGISKEDIKDWIKEAVENVAKQMVAKSFENFSINQIVSKYVVSSDIFSNKHLTASIEKAVASEILTRFKVEVKMLENNP